MPYRDIIGVPGPIGSLAVNDTDASPSDVSTAIAAHAALVSNVHGLQPTTARNLDIWIDAVNGVDTNNGLSKLTPLKTIDGYFLKYGQEVGAPLEPGRRSASTSPESVE